ncbi:hypothetical protein CHS0354_012492 [Potamilus streckersoni]|uniref:Uncharacterized protein n=1 Tax=Potamilus streckersoni TaxID=2493646 RepID=A0AAE0S0U9_9BIVA|nr:hypothetical protein CHS0354_012492 [Potamilus streckersoni]
MSPADELVPAWVNIVVPILMVAVFVAAIVTTYFCKYEVPAEKLPKIDRWVPCLKKVIISKDGTYNGKFKPTQNEQASSESSFSTRTGTTRQNVFSLLESRRTVGPRNNDYLDANSIHNSHSISSLNSSCTNKDYLRILHMQAYENLRFDSSV